MINEELCNDYDTKKKSKNQAEPAKNQTKNQKKKQKKQKKQNEDSLSNISEESGIRLGNESVEENREDRRQKYLNRNKYDSQSKIDNESDELNELMNQEMMREVNNNNQDSAVKLDSNGCNITTDMETNNERPSFISN